MNGSGWFDICSPWALFKLENLINIPKPICYLTLSFAAMESTARIAASGEASKAISTSSSKLVSVALLLQSINSAAKRNRSHV
ncbi:hypothetical protein D9M68_884030 [compost metagenome]